MAVVRTHRAPAEKEDDGKQCNNKKYFSSSMLFNGFRSGGQKKGSVRLRREELTNDEGVIDGKYHKYLTADSVDSELTLILTITVLQTGLICTCPQFYSHDDLIEYDLGNSYLSFSLSQVLTPFIWASIQMNVIPFFLAWIMFMVWRTIRPYPNDTYVARAFYSYFSPFLSAICIITVLGFFMLSLSYYFIMVLKSGPEQVHSQLFDFWLAIAYFVALGCVCLYCVYAYFRLTAEFNAEASYEAELLAKEETEAPPSSTSPGHSSL